MGTVRTLPEKILGTNEWNNFEDLLIGSGFWLMLPTVYKKYEYNPDRVDGGVRFYVIEAHLKNQYRFILRNEPDSNLVKVSDYLVKLSGLKR